MAKDGISGGDLGDGIGMNDVATVGQGVAERNLRGSGAGLEREMLVSDSGGAAILGDGDDDDGQVESFGGSVGDLYRAVNAIVVGLRRLIPFQEQ